MVNHATKNLDNLFSALSDPTRRAILARLSRGAASVTEVAEPFEMSLPAISKHLRILENAGLIVRLKEGRVHHLRLSAAPLQSAAAWLADYRQFWDEQFDSLAQFLEATPDEENSDERP
jgi:DNA-binding transcriptional ArsR family regulator